MRKLKWITSLLLLFNLQKLNSQTNTPVANEFSLQGAIDYALKNSPSMANADIDAKLNDLKRKEILGVGLPQLSGSFDFKDFVNIPTSVLPNFIAPATLATLMGKGLIPYNPAELNADLYPPVAAQFGTQYNATAGLSLSQLIFSSDYIVGLQAAKELVLLGEKNKLRTKTETVQNVSKAYYMVLVNKERVKLLDANLVKLKKILDDTKAYNVQGFVEKIDVDRLEVTYNNLNTEKEKTNRLIGLSETLLKFQMSYKLSDPISLSDTLGEKPENITVSATPNFSSRPEMQLLESQKKLNQLELRRYKLSYLPTVVGYGSLSSSGLRSEFDFLDNVSQKWYPTAVIGATINLPIFDGLQKHYRIQQAKLNAQKTDNTIKSLNLAFEMESIGAATNYTNALASIENQKRNLELAKNILDVAEKKYSAGVGSNLEIINAQTSYVEAQTNYYNSLYDLLSSKIDYQKSVGTLVK